MSGLVDFLSEYGDKARNYKTRASIPEVAEALNSLGITDYKGTSRQNISLLNYLRNKKNSPTYIPQRAEAISLPIRQKEYISVPTTNHQQTAIAGLPPRSVVETSYAMPSFLGVGFGETSNEYVEPRFTMPSMSGGARTVSYSDLVNTEETQWWPTQEEVDEMGRNYIWYQTARPYLGINEKDAGKDNPRTKNRAWDGTPTAGEFSAFVSECLNPGDPYCNISQKFVYTKLPQEQRKALLNIGDSLRGSSLQTMNLLRKKRVHGVSLKDYLQNPFGDALFVFPGHTGYVVGYKKIKLPDGTEKIKFVTIEGNHQFTTPSGIKEGFHYGVRDPEEFPQPTKFYILHQ